VQLLKAMKNQVELAGIRAAHVRDGAALTRYFAWLEAAVTRGVDARKPGSPPLGFVLNEVRGERSWRRRW
jgi:hypothetical protein